MTDKYKNLESPRKRIDEIDEHILELLSERGEIVRDVIKRKVESQLPVFVPDREDEKSEAFKNKAKEKGIDPEWAEDFLRMIMSSSRATQSQEKFPIATDSAKTILFIGGEGGMGSLYKRIADQTGHHTYSIDKSNWYELEEMVPNLDMVIVTVPINVTLSVIERLKGRLKTETILADFTSNKSKVMAAMLENHDGPVIGLHPMHGPDVQNLSKQLMVYSPARDAEKADWFIQQCELWGMRNLKADPEKHDHV